MPQPAGTPSSSRWAPGVGSSRTGGARIHLPGRDRAPGTSPGSSAAPPRRTVSRSRTILVPTPRRPTRCASSRRWDADLVQQSHLPRQPQAPSGALPDQPNERNGEALQSITDPGVDASGCCGSARRLPNRDWLIDWGGYENNPIGSYKPGGERIFLLRFKASAGYSYRAEPVPATIGAGPAARRHERDVYRALPTLDEGK